MSSHCLPNKNAKVVENRNALQPDQVSSWDRPQARIATIGDGFDAA
jgi:hypothetical protein